MSDDNTPYSQSELATLTQNAITNPPKELSDRQLRIVNYKLRGMTQASMAKLEQVSQPMISKEIKAIKAVYKAQGANIDQDEVVGESVHLFSEVEKQAWGIFHLAKKNDKPGAANSALMTIMTAREKGHKLLMELGILKKVAIEHDHKVSVAPFVEQFENMKQEAKENALKDIIEVQLAELEEPEPPKLVADIALDDLEEPEAPNDTDN